jgi:hypothetical protein
VVITATLRASTPVTGKEILESQMRVGITLGTATDVEQYSMIKGGNYHD